MFKFYRAQGWFSRAIGFLERNAKLLNRPRGFTVSIRDIRLMAGAGYIVCYAGDIMTMPGLPKVPAAERAQVADDGTLTGLMPV